VSALLQAGYVPVLHGDCVLDSTLGVTILSGDTIMRQLAEAFRPQYCAFLTDVPGLYTKPPNVPGAVLVPEVLVAPDGAWTIQGTAAPTAAAAAAIVAAGSPQASHAELQFSAAAHDTTGGIATKIAEAAGVVLSGSPVVIAQAGTASGAAAVLLGPAGFVKQHSSTGHSAHTSNTQQYNSGTNLTSPAVRGAAGPAAVKTVIGDQLSCSSKGTAAGDEGAYDVGWLRDQQLQGTVLRMAHHHQ
jgi:glutamate 5-kinase